MGKKVKEYKSGDFIFAKVKGYPAWPARVQRLNGKKYFVYFYGTGETANLAPNMIFDYAENKDKFLTKTVKRRDFNDGVKQIEYDFANNVPLEQVIGVPMEVGAEANDTANDSAIDATMDESVADTTANETLNDTADDANATQNDAVVEDSDEAGTLVIDEGKTPAKGKKPKVDPKAKETPKAKEPKTPRGKAKKDDSKEKEEEKGDEELVSRSGRKIRPKRYIDEQTEENTTLPPPATKRRRGASPEKEKDGAKEKGDGAKEKADSGKDKANAAKDKEEKNDKTFTQFSTVKQSELEVLKEPFKPADEDKDNILIAYLPNSTYVGIKLFQSRPNSFKNEASRLQWDKQAAANAITLKRQLEKNHITPESVQGQLVMDLNLTDEEKATLDKERETEEKKSRVNFLKTEMKLIELDAKIKTCLCLEKADTELCLTLLDELLSLDVKPLMLLKHPTCLETVKRMRAYVGNTPSWDLSESAALVFSKQAHKIRKKADTLYRNMKEHFQTPEGLSFWEYFSERVLVFKKATSVLGASELLEMVHEPIELSQPYAHTMKAAIEQANHTVPPLPDAPGEEEKKKKPPTGKAKKTTANSTPSKSKRQSSRNKAEEEKTEDAAEKETEKVAESSSGEAEKESVDGTKEKEIDDSSETPKEPESTLQVANEDVEMAEAEKAPETEPIATDAEKETENALEVSEASEKVNEPEKPTENKTDKSKEPEKSKQEKSSKKDKKSKESDKSESEKSNDDDKSTKDDKKSDKISSKTKESDKSEKSERSGRDKKSSKDSDKSSKDISKNGKDKDDKSGKDRDSEKSGKDKDDKEDKTEPKTSESEKSDDKESGEHRVKRSRESKKTEAPPPRSPAKRKSKF